MFYDFTMHGAPSSTVMCPGRSGHPATGLEMGLDRYQTRLALGVFLATGAEGPTRAQSVGWRILNPAAIDFLPIHQRPPSLNVIRPAVLILQVVGVLPHIQPE